MQIWNFERRKNLDLDLDTPEAHHLISEALNRPACGKNGYSVGKKEPSRQ